MDRPLLNIDRLSLGFRTRGGIVRALDDVSLSLHKGETLGLVGESGSGKSVLSFAVMRILDSAAQITAGSIDFAGMDLLAMPESQLQQVRGREMAMVFQNPRLALNPIRRVGQQLEDVLRRHQALPAAQLKQRAVSLLQQVRIPDPARRYLAYPAQLSGGQCQRVMIALALACDPALLIADEPTTGLDVTTQATVMALIRDLGQARGLTTLLITHDLALAAENCDRIAVMHAGQIVELATSEDLFRAPLHPYTQALIRSMPSSASSVAHLGAIDGSLPDLRRVDLPACRFAERCAQVMPQCRDQALPRVQQHGRWVACHLHAMASPTEPVAMA